MNNRLTLAALSLAVAVLSFNCGMPMTKTDAGSGGGIGATGGGGGGGGATGGGTATGGGSARVCDPAPAFVQADTIGVGYDPGGTLDGGNLADYNFAGLGRASDAGAGRFDVSFNEFYAAAPVTARAIPATTYALCDACFYINTNCDNMGTNCAKSYLAQGGTYAITAATKNAAAGTFTFTLTDVVYEAWDFRQGQDRATDAGCLSLPSLTFTGTWP